MSPIAKFTADQIRQKAIDALTPHLSSKSPKDKIIMGNQFLVQSWVKQGLVDIALDKNLEVEYLRQEPYAFDQESITKFFYIQSKAWQQQVDTVNNNIQNTQSYSYHSAYSTTPKKFVLETYVAKRVEEMFAKELAGASYNRGENP